MEQKIDLPACSWLSSYVTSCHLTVVPQSDVKDQFYCTVYYKLAIKIVKLKEHLKFEKKCKG
jgi:hypothetical protein